MPERLSFVPTYHAAAVEECLASDEHVAKLLGRAASQHLEQARLTLTPTLTLTLTLTLNPDPNPTTDPNLTQVRLVLWSDYSETDVRAVAMQLKLLEQTLDTLAEFVQAQGGTGGDAM